MQIRSEEMHRRAEEGIAAHWKYKEGRVGDQRDERYFQWLRQLLEVQQEVRDPQEFMQNLKIDLYPEEVYIFTPKGEVRSLPRGATPVDFAYGIHTDVGNQCVARGHQRQDGAAAHAAAERRHRRDPHAARPQAEPRLAGVRRHLARAQQDQARAAGRGARAQHRARPAAVREGSAALRPEPEDAAREPTRCMEFAGEYGAPKVEDLLAYVGYGKLAPRTLVQKAVPGGLLKEKAPDGPWSRWSSACCAPGRVGQDQGKGHRRRDGVPRPLLQPDSRRAHRRLHHARQRRVGALGHVQNVVNLLFDPERRIDVEWDTGEDLAPYVVKLTMQVEDRKGMLAEISSRCRTSTPTSPTWRRAPATIVRRASR